MSEKFQAKKSLGQHFLKSDIVPGWMCDAAKITEEDTVLEIGPGTGVLTQELLLRGARVIALEADVRSTDVLKEKFKDEITSGNLVLKHTDVRTLDLSCLPYISDHSFKLVSNIPYYLSGMLFRIFLDSDIQPNTLVYLVQKEVAKRITSDISKGEKESLLSLSVKVFGEVAYVKTVTRGHFTPVPNVDSAIVSVRNINRDNFITIERNVFFEILHLGFGQKRKQLLGNLTKKYDRKILTHIFSTLPLPVSVRAEDISLKTWLKLTAKLLSTQ